MKECGMCSEVLPLSSFYKNKRTKDGLQARCKSCNQKATKVWSEQNKEVRKEHQRRSYYKNWKSRAGTPKKTGTKDNCTAEQRSAWKAVENAVYRGTIVKPNICSDCGAKHSDPRKITGHHEDYSRKLEVVWLCWPCHAKLHRRYPRR